ncbi:hypothetical protein [Pelagicoccus sp. SDUM812003]|uniref:hypothetical protein n=1 Tax=Pelagicoccus sp. SDUM812003 TaxID=3041267 RepID=UPI00280D8BE8|nr:hypothetical protein [Pelagicoccus sp. SDUM812003]MDQ8203362.1 hypothetical protein [Pelagicoccus sp. SDUM812003]
MLKVSAFSWGRMPKENVIWIQKRRRERGECRAQEGRAGKSSISLLEAVVEQRPVSSPCGWKV